MRWLTVCTFVSLLSVGPAAAQKPDSQGTVTLKQPKKRGSAGEVAKLKDEGKPKPKPTDQDGVANLKDQPKNDKATDARRRDKVDSVVEQHKADEAKRRENIEKMIEQSKNRKKK